jgi:hypothetical protein
MAETTGIVQKLTVIPGAALACIWIGPTPTNTEALFIAYEAGDAASTTVYQGSMVDALAAAAVTRREVVAIHDTTSARISSLRIDPA